MPDLPAVPDDEPHPDKTSRDGGPAAPVREQHSRIPAQRRMPKQHLWPSKPLISQHAFGRGHHTFSTAGQSPGLTSRLAVERSAATATDRASLGSFLLVSPTCSSRTRDASLGCTSSTRSPAATSCWASSRLSPAAPSTAQVPSGHDEAQVTSSSAWVAEARTRSSPSGCSAAPITTAVCDPLCGSTPIITISRTWPRPQDVAYSPVNRNSDCHGPSTWTTSQ